MKLEVAVAGSLPLFYEQGSGVVLSPDGDRLAFTTGLASDTSTFRLNLRPLDRLDSSEVAGTGAAYNPFFSPDGRDVDLSFDRPTWALPRQPARRLASKRPMAAMRSA